MKIKSSYIYIVMSTKLPEKQFSDKNNPFGALRPETTDDATSTDEFHDAVQEKDTTSSDDTTPDDSEYHDVGKGEDSQVPTSVFLKEYVFPEGFDIKTFEEKSEDPLKQLVKFLEMASIKNDNFLDLLEAGLGELLIFKDSIACQEMPTLYVTLIENAIHNLYQQMISSQNLSDCKEIFFTSLKADGEEALQVLLTANDKSEEEVFKLICEKVEGTSSEKDNFQKMLDSLQTSGEILTIGNDPTSPESLQLSAYSRDFKLIVEGATMQQKKINEELLKIIKENPEKSVRDAKIVELMGQYTQVSLDEFEEKIKLAPELDGLQSGGGKKLLKAFLAFLAATTGASASSSTGSMQRQDSPGGLQRQDSLSSVAPFSFSPATKLPIPHYEEEGLSCAYKIGQNGTVIESTVTDLVDLIGKEKGKTSCADYSQVDSYLNNVVDGITREVQTELEKEGISMDLILKNDDGTNKVALNKKSEIVGSGLKKFYESRLPEETKLVAMSNLLATTKTPFTNEMLKQLLGPDAPVETELGLVSGFPPSKYEDRQLVIQIFKKTGLERVVPQSTIENTVSLYGELIKKNSGAPRIASYDVTQQVNIETYNAVKDFFKSGELNLDVIQKDISTFLREDPEDKNSKISIAKRDALLEYLSNKYVEKKEDSGLERKVPTELQAKIDEMFISFREASVSSMEVKVGKQNTMFETSKGRITSFISMIQGEYVKNQQKLETQKEKLQKADSSYTDEELTIFTEKVVADSSMWGYLGYTQKVTDKTEYRRKSLFKTKIAQLYESRLKSDTNKIAKNVAVRYTPPGRKNVFEQLQEIPVTRSQGNNRLQPSYSPQDAEAKAREEAEKAREDAEAKAREAREDEEAKAIEDAQKEAKKGIAVLSLEGEGSLSDVGVVKVGPTGELKPAGPSEESRNALQLFNALSKKEENVIPTITAQLRTTDVDGEKKYELVYVCDKCMNNNYLKAIPQLLSEFAQAELVFNQYLLCHKANLDVETCLNKLYSSGRDYFEKSDSREVKEAYAAYVNSEQQFEGLEVVESAVGLFQTFPTIGGYPDVPEVGLEEDDMNEVIGLYNEFNATSTYLNDYLTTKADAEGNLRKFAALLQKKKDEALNAAAEAERANEADRIAELGKQMKHRAKMIRDKMTAQQQLMFEQYHEVIDAMLTGNKDVVEKEYFPKGLYYYFYPFYNWRIGLNGLYMSWSGRMQTLLGFYILTFILYKVFVEKGVFGCLTQGAVGAPKEDLQTYYRPTIAVFLSLFAAPYADSTIEYLVKNTPILIGQFNNLNTTTKLVIGGVTITLTVGTYFLFRTNDGRFSLVKGDASPSGTSSRASASGRNAGSRSQLGLPDSTRLGIPSFARRGGYIKPKAKKSTNKNRKANKTKKPRHTRQKNKKSKHNSSQKKNNKKTKTKKHRHTIRHK